MQGSYEFSSPTLIPRRRGEKEEEEEEEEEREEEEEKRELISPLQLSGIKEPSCPSLFSRMPILILHIPVRRQIDEICSCYPA